MKKKNSLIPFCLLLLILFFLSGCVSYNEFAQRKYLKGNFYDKAERYPVIHLKECRTETPQGDTVTNVNIDPLATAAVETTKNNFPVLYLKNRSFIIDRMINIVPEINNNIILFKKDSSAVPDKVPENDTERNSKQALLFGILTVVGFLLVFTSILGFIFAPIALVKAAKVLRDSNANQKQISRARTGKTLAIIFLSINAVALLLGILFIVFFLRGGGRDGWG